MSGNEKTAGDLVFEAFLEGQDGYSFDYEPDLAARFSIDTEKCPDYLAQWRGHEAVCEVKSFETSKLDRRMRSQSYGSASPEEVFGPAREAIRAAASQLRPFQGLGLPLVVVLTNPKHIHVDLGEYAMVGAIAGNLQAVTPINTDDGGPMGPTRTETGRDGVLLRDRRYVSAVLVAWAEGANVYETRCEEATPLPAGMFDSENGIRYGFRTETEYGRL